MMIALTYRCNMGCTHCISDCKPDGIDMSKDTLIDSLDEKDIINKISHFNCNKCTYALEQLKKNNLPAYNLLINE